MIADVLTALGVAPPTPPPDEAVPEVPFSFISGQAGTGKTFLSRRWADLFGAQLTSTTGIAAINLGGTTINSLLGYFDTDSLQDAYINGWLVNRLIKLRDKIGMSWIILDEVSMMSAHQLTVIVRAINDVNHLHRHASDPLIKLTVVGDFAQLRPVNEPMAFTSPEWKTLAEHTTHLTAIRRQADAAFIEGLRAVRVGDGAKALEFFAPLMKPGPDLQFNGTMIRALNEDVRRFNELHMDQLQTRELKYVHHREGKQRGEWKLIPAVGYFKIGALVMILSNQKVPGTQEFAYVNGDLGILVDGSDSPVSPIAYVKLHRTGQVVPVPLIERTLTKPHPSGQPGHVITEGKIRYMPLRAAWATTVHKCLLAGTRVSVVGRGLLPIEAVQVGDFVFSGQGHTCRVIAAAPTGTKELITVRFASGRTLYMSPDHPLLAPDGLFIPYAKVNQQVVIGQDVEPITRTWITPLPSLVQTARGSKAVVAPPEMSPKLAWWLGALLGDGSMRDRRDGTLEFHARDEAVVGRFCSYTHDLFKLRVRRYPNKLYVISRALRAWLYELGLHYSTATNKTIPETIFRSTVECRAAFVQGLFDTDGCVDKRGLRYVTTSSALATGMQQLLDSIGIHDTQIFTQIPTFEYKNVKRHGNRAYTVHVRRRDVRRFADRVGLFHTERSEKLEHYAAKPVRILPCNKTSGEVDRIIEIKQTGLQVPLHNLEVEGDHSFTANGLVVSNTQGLSFDAVQIDIRNRFFKEPGMLYVALSRCRTAQGLRLVGAPRHFMRACQVNPEVVPWL